ncbi:MAG TPA: Lar family restriction alleviation protein [Steroidobacteraceae bacterium]|nr:Lar family restriction alleviation protein [Steroidobacteraceae bacterium]
MDHLIEDSDRLKPCPFCCSAAEIITLEGEAGPDDPSIGAQCVQCTNSACGAASGLIYPLMDDVSHLLMERWNKREVPGAIASAQPAPWPQMLAALASIDTALGLPEDGCNSTARTLAAIRELRAEAAKSERRSIAFGDIVESQVLAMQAAVLAGHLESPAHGLQWIVNTLAGPGHLPDLEEAKALGGAQAWFDRETAKHEEFRRAHPGPKP